MSTMREQFEAWIAAYGGSTTTVRGRYVSAVTECSWVTWQAATQATERRLAEAVCNEVKAKVDRISIALSAAGYPWTPAITAAIKQAPHIELPTIRRSRGRIRSTA